MDSNKRHTAIWLCEINSFVKSLLKGTRNIGGKKRVPVALNAFEIWEGTPRGIGELGLDPGQAHQSQIETQNSTLGVESKPSVPIGA